MIAAVRLAKTGLWRDEKGLFGGQAAEGHPEFLHRGEQPLKVERYKEDGIPDLSAYGSSQTKYHFFSVVELAIQLEIAYNNVFMSFIAKENFFFHIES